MAARAVGDAILALDPDQDLDYVDLLAVIPGGKGQSLASGYNTLATRARPIWRALYAAADRSRYSPLPFLLPRLFDPKSVSAELFPADCPLIICTHPFVLMFAPDSHAHRIWSVVTDLRAHASWASPNVHRFFVATPFVASDLADHGVHLGSIDVSGMPVRNTFGPSPNHFALRRSIGLEPDKPAALIMPPWHNPGLALDLISCLTSSDPALQIIVVAGRDEGLRRTLESKLRKVSHLVRGWSDNIAELMAAADVIVTKPGGQIVSEAIATEMPMVLLDPIPGQEEENARYLSSAGLGVPWKGIDQIPLAIRSSLWADSAERRALRAQLGKSFRFAAGHIARMALDTVGSSTIGEDLDLAGA